VKVLHVCKFNSNLNIVSNQKFLINDAETVSTIDAKGVQILIKKSNVENKLVKKPQSKELHNRSKGSVHVNYNRNVSINNLFST
jgi:sporulation protein YlmC with PRC-barrel domain